MQETQDQSLIQEDPTCCRATKLVHYNYWACALESWNHNYLGSWTLEPVLHNKRSHRNETLEGNHQGNPWKLLIMKVLFSQSKCSKIKISLGSYSAQSFSSLSMEKFKFLSRAYVVTPPSPLTFLSSHRELLTVLPTCCSLLFLLAGRLCSKASLLDVEAESTC